jgi:hypothetical protein
MADLRERVRRLLARHGYTVVKSSTSGGIDSDRRAIGTTPQADLTVLAGGLRAIACEELDYQTWIGILHAAKAVSGGDPNFLQDVFIPWSLTHPQASDPQWIVDK